MNRTDAIGFARETEPESRTIEGIAVPYGVVSGETELTTGSGQIIREVWAPGAFAKDAARYMERMERTGTKIAFRPAHGERAVGVVDSLTDTPEGLMFRASISRKPAGDDYLADVRSGLNGVSAEGMWAAPPVRMKGGTLLHREGRIHAIAGALAPAFDGARIALRDMEAAMNQKVDPEPEPEPEPTPEPEPVTLEVVPRGSAERATVSRALGSAITTTRPELVYGPTTDHNFLRDAWLASPSGGMDGAAIERQARHRSHLTDIAVQMERAGDLLQSEIPGALPTDFLPGLLTPRILKGRVMGSFFDRFPISDTRPRTFAKVTTSGSVAVQSAEGAVLTSTDIATTAVTATPLMYGTFIDVSRQVMDSADPSATTMVMQDLVEAYAQASETVIKTAVEAGASASGTAITAATPFAGTLANVITYYTTRFKPALGAFIPSALFSVLLAQADTTGRPFMPLLNPMNSDGSVRPGGVEGSILDATTYLSYASTANVCVFSRPNDYVIYESSLASFSYDQVVGPQSVRIGLWAYLVVGTRLGSLKVTAA